MKLVKILVPYIFFAICIFFSLGMLIPGASKLTEGGEMPKLVSDSRINRNFGNEFEEYFSKAFAYRSYVVDAYSDLRLLLGTGNDQVIVGRDGYLFFADTLDAYTGQNPMTDDEISAAADSLLRLQEYSESIGARFCFLPAPDKNTILSGKMPKRYIKAEVTDLDRLLSRLDELGVTYADPRAGLRKYSEDLSISVNGEDSGYASAKSEQIYYRTDTHWTPFGASIAFDLVAEKLGITPIDLSTLGVTDSFIAGDLHSLLYPGRKGSEYYKTHDFSESFIFTSAFSTEMDMVITTRGGGTGRAMIFRDSFMNSMLQYAASSFSEATFERANPYRIDKADADYIIVEIAERNLRDLIGSDSRITE